MIIDRNILARCYCDAAILQTQKDLTSNGYSVTLGKEIEFNEKKFCADLYAEKNHEKRMYEFKLVGNEFQQYRKDIMYFKNIAKAIGAKAIVTYVNLPLEKTIEFDGLAEKIEEYLESDGIPQSIDCLSTHSSIDALEIDTITDCEITDDQIAIKGYATIYTMLQWGSNSDLKHEDGLEQAVAFPMNFDVTLDLDLEIQHIEYDIDTNSWYGRDE